MTTVDRIPTDWGDLARLGPRHISTLPRYWITRLYVALPVIFSIVVTVRESDSLTHRLIDRTGEQGWWIVGVLAFICVVAVADVIVNDLLPACYTLPSFKRWRHLVYIGLSIGIFCMSYVFVVGERGYFRPLVLPFWLDGLVAAVVAFLDLFQRHRAPQ